MRIEPYLFFNGRCEEAIQFYKTRLGAEVQMMMRNAESPEPPPPGVLPPGSEQKIMHASLLIGGSIAVAGMATMHFARYGWPRRAAVAAQA